MQVQAGSGIMLSQNFFQWLFMLLGQYAPLQLVQATLVALALAAAVRVALVATTGALPV